MVISRRAVLKAGLYGGLSAGLSSILSLSGCSKRHRSKPNIVVIVIDTLRPDYLGFYGFGRETAPFMAGLAKKSVVFERAFAPSSWTAPSTASLFTSIYPHRHGVIEGFYCHKFRMEKLKKEGKAELPLNRIPAGLPTLPQIFKAAGYTTFGLAANINVGGEIGFDRGFDSFERINDAPAEVFLERIQKLKQQFGKSAPFMLYLHFNDPHSPYLAHQSYYRAQSDPRADSRERYISEIGYADEYAGKCLGTLALGDNSIIAVVSDHGEEFWDHGLDSHRPRLYRELTNVLMMLHVPFITKRPVRIGVNVSLLDVVPTLADLAGIEPGQKFEGTSLAPLLTVTVRSKALSEQLDARTIFAHRIINTPEQQIWAAIFKQWNFIQRPDKRIELFNHTLDFAEKSNVFSQHAGIGRQLADAIGRFQKLAPLGQAEKVQVQLDEKLLDNLKSLGYVESLRQIVEWVTAGECFCPSRTQADYPSGDRTMGRIITLDQNMVNMIAAGEVVERPASVVKELVENSIDGEATKVTVAVEDGGRKLISVADDGCGMDAEDLACAFEPHTTSKIRVSADLRNISTLGFRGEALASIASVAMVRAVSRTRDELSGSCIEVDCGDKGAVGPASADFGTTIQVRDIFYKLPARRKFLKTANTEITHIIEQFTRIAIANSNLDLTLIHNGRELYRLTAGQTILARIAELFSPETASCLLETQSEERGLHISALLGRPDNAKTSNAFQYVFLNGRYIRDKFISHAIREAYRGSIEPSRFPIVFLFIQMPYEDYDVNVHPTKIEVRFFNANLVHSQILACLREKLLSTDLDTTARMPAARVAGDLGRDKRIAEAMEEFFKRHRPAGQRHLDFVARDSGLVTRGLGNERRETSHERRYIQIHDSFIVAEDDEGFVIIDQHALHERILYEDLKRRVEKSKLESQKLLMPETFRLTDRQSEALAANGDLIDKLGIEIVPFGPRTAAIQAFPVLLAKAEAAEFIKDLADLLAEKGQTADRDGLLDEVLHMAACKAAIKAGRKLADNEIEQLLADRETIEHSSHCPHGRPAAIKFTLSELEKQFKRT
jgi:DNA mismatch repair protein MutL